MPLNLYFLGSPRIERDGHVIETDTRKAVAMLAYLAVTGNYHSRDTLAALLWPEMDDERARAALRRTLSALRSAVGDKAIFVTRDGLSINEDECWCDTMAFQATVDEVNRHPHTATPCADCLQKMESAVALYRDHFMSGFSLRDSAEFDNWQLAVTEHLRRSFAAALAWLVQTYSLSGELGRATELARRWLAIDPLREEVHRWLMQLFAWQGARDAALRQYREAVHILDEELGVGPLPETTALYEAIQEGRATPPAPITPSLATAPQTVTPPQIEATPTKQIPLVGRESAWTDLDSVYGEVVENGRLVAVTGEPGIGKTRLIKEFLTHARRNGATTAMVTCYEGEANLAYAPVTATLRALLRQATPEKLAALPSPWLAEVSRLLPELEMDPHPHPDASSPGAQARFYTGICEAICHLLQGDAGGVLFLDDVHWADDASIDLLAYLTRRLVEHSLLLILSWTDEASAMGGNTGQLRRLTNEAQRAGTGRHITLTRWRPSDVLGLVATYETLRPVATDITDRLYRETEGLPYFVVEYLEMLGQTPDTWTMPQSVRDLLAGRLTQVDNAGVQLLQTAAVIGRSFDYTTLLAASGRSEEEVVGGLEKLLAGGLVREVTDGAAPTGDLYYDFAHQQLRSLVYEETNLARRRLLHRRVATALQAQTHGAQGDSLASLIAGHYHLGGQDDMAADYYRRAGHRAKTVYANREALAHFQAALALGHPDAPSLHEAIGDLNTLLGQYQAALQAYESAAAQAPAGSLGRLEHKLGGVYERRGNRELADSHYCAALSHFQDAGQIHELAQLNVDRSRVAYQSGAFATARSLAEEALRVAEAAADIPAEAQAHNTLGLLARQDGQTGEARAHLERSRALADATGLSSIQVASLNNLARLLESEGDTAEALSLVEHAIALCTRVGDRHREAALYDHRADILHRMGKEEAAMSSLKQAVAIYAEIGMESGGWQPEIWKLTEW